MAARAATGWLLRAAGVAAACCLALTGCAGRVEMTASHTPIAGDVDLARWELRGSIMWSARNANVAGFHPQSGLLVVLYGGAIRLWDVDTGRVARSAPVDTGGRWATMSADGRRVAVGGRVLDVATGTTVAAIQASYAGPNGFALNADGTRVATRPGNTGVVSVWDVATGKLVREMQGHPGPGSVALTPDGEAVAAPGGARFGVQTWDVESGRPLAVYSGHEGAVRAILFTADGRRIITGSNDGTARLWDVASGEMIRDFGGSSAAIRSLALGREDRLLATGSQSSEAVIWNLESGDPLRRHNHGRRPIYSLSLSPDGSRLATSENTVRVWDLERRSSALFPLEQDSDRALLGVSPDGRRAVTGARDGTADLWNLEGRTYVARLLLGAARGSHQTATFSQDSSLVLMSQRGSDASLFDATSGAPLHRYSVGPGSYALPAVTSDLRWMATRGRDDIALWNLRSGERLTAYGLPAGPVFQIAISPGGKTVAAVAAEGVVHAWNTESATALQTIQHASWRPPGIAHVSDEGGVLITPGDGVVIAWDAATGASTRLAPPGDGAGEHGTAVRWLRTQDESVVAMLGADGVGWMWSAADPLALRAVTAPKGGPFGMTGDGRLVSGEGAYGDVDALSLGPRRYTERRQLLSRDGTTIVRVSSAGLDVWVRP